MKNVRLYIAAVIIVLYSSTAFSYADSTPAETTENCPEEIVFPENLAVMQDGALKLSNYDSVKKAVELCIKLPIVNKDQKIQSLLVVDKIKKLESIKTALEKFAIFCKSSSFALSPSMLNTVSVTIMPWPACLSSFFSSEVISLCR